MVGSWHIDDRYRLNDSRWICSSFRRDFIISQASFHLEAAAWNTLKRPDLRRASGQRNASRNSRKRRDRYWVNSARIHPRSSSSVTSEGTKVEPDEIVQAISAVNGGGNGAATAPLAAYDAPADPRKSHNRW